MDTCMCVQASMHMGMHMYMWGAHYICVQICMCTHAYTCACVSCVCICMCICTLGEGLFVCRLKKSLAAAMGSASRFFLLCGTGTYRHGPLVVCLGVLAPALCSFSWGSVSEAETAKAVHTKRQARDPQPPASLQGPSSLGRILCYHGDLGAPQSLANSL